MKNKQMSRDELITLRDQIKDILDQVERLISPDCECGHDWDNPGGTERRRNKGGNWVEHTGGKTGHWEGGTNIVEYVRTCKRCGVEEVVSTYA